MKSIGYRLGFTLIRRCGSTTSVRTRLSQPILVASVQFRGNSTKKHILTLQNATPIRNYSYTTEQRPVYHNPLYFIKQEDGRTAVTFMDTQKPLREQIIGWINGGEANSGTEVEPSNFEENPDFFKTVHDAIAAVVHEDPSLNAQAKYAAMMSKSGGHVHVGDQRNPAGDGRIPYPHDIIGSCQYDATGRILPGTYSPCSVWRPVTADFGLFQLDEFLHDAVVKALKK